MPYLLTGQVSTHNNIERVFTELPEYIMLLNWLSMLFFQSFQNSNQNLFN